MTAQMQIGGVDGQVQLAAETVAAPTFHTVEGVEIAHVGMDWPSASGPITLTLQHLADAVTAAGEDPHILSPRLKLGHTDPRFNEDPPVYDPFAYHGPLREDGNPVYGKVANLRLAEDGMVLLGDYVEVPDWLYAALPSAYPSRSLEGDGPIETEGGKHYSFVITAVALLGEPLPAITCLDDLVRELTGGPAAVTAAAPINLAKETAMPVAAEASSDAVRAQFFDEYAVGDRYWWWPCELRVDAGWVLADDDEGHLYRVPFETDDNGAVTFGDPVAGVLDFREIPDPEAGEQEPVAASRGLHFSNPAAAGRPKDRVRPVAAATTTGGTTMADGAESTVSTGLLERLGLPEDATEEQIQEATISKLDELETAATAPETEPVAASQGVTVAPDALEQLQEDARLGREAREQQITLEREQLVDERVRGGYITPTSRTAHLAELAKGGEVEKAHRGYLASLTAAIVPVEERGTAPASASQSGSDDGWFAGREIKRNKETT